MKNLGSTWRDGDLGVARQLGLLEPTRVAEWLCGSENSID